MLTRCRNPNNIQWYLYGGRGITVCERWSGPNGFSNFFKDMGPRPVDHSIDRIDVNGHYEPRNCRWATAREQSNNTRMNHTLTYQGQTYSVREWGRRTGLGGTISSRIRSRWSVEQILTTPAKPRQRELSYKGTLLSKTGQDRKEVG